MNITPPGPTVIGPDASGHCVVVSYQDVAPPAASLAAAQGVLTSGQAAMLAYLTSGADQANLTGPPAVSLPLAPGAGTATVFPPPAAGTYPYTLTALNTVTRQQAQAGASVQVLPVPSVQAFTAAPSPVTVGQTLTLTWQTADATQVALAANGATFATSLPPAGSEPFPVNAAGAYTFTLTATGPGGTVMQTVSVTAVYPPPAFTAAGFNPPTVHLGQTTVLSWATQNATQVTVNGGAPQPPTGSLTLTPPAVGPQTYNLQATGPGGTVLGSAIVLVEQPLPLPPAFLTFTLTPSTVDVNNKSTLAWTTQNADSVSINNGPALAANGSMQVSQAIAGDYTYQGVATQNSTGATAQTTAILHVTNPAPSGPTASLRQTFGQQVQLSSTGVQYAYSTTNADVISLSDTTGRTLTNLPASGSGVWPLPNTSNLVVTITLSAIKSSTGETATSLITVTVLANAPNPPEPAEPAPYLNPTGRPNVGGRNPLSPANFAFVGAFGLSKGAGVPDINTSRTGLASRGSGGARTFLLGGSAGFSASPTNDALAEYGLVNPVDPTVIIPGASGFPMAPVVAFYGDIYDSPTSGIRGSQGGSRQTGSFLYYSGFTASGNDTLVNNFGVGYNTGPPVTKVVLTTTFNSGYVSGTTVTTRGPWGAASGPVWQANKAGAGLCKIPGYFASGYTSGMDVGCGFGGEYTIVTTDSEGSCLFAINYPTGAAGASGLGNIPFLTLMDHPPANQQESSGTARPEIRFGDYTTVGPTSWWFDPGAVYSGYGTYGPADVIHGCGCWIDTGTADGMLFVASQGVGQTAYVNSSLYTDYAETRAYLYASADLAAIAQGQVPPWSVLPVAMWQLDLPVRPSRTSGVPGNPINCIPDGAFYAQETQLLYLKCDQCFKDGVEYAPLMYVYQVSG